MRYRQRQVHDEIAEEAGQQMPRDDGAFFQARELGRQHVVFLAQADQFAADDARQARPAHRRQYQRDAEINLNLRPFRRNQRRQRHPQRQGRQGLQELDHALDEHIRGAAVIAGDAAEDQTEDEANRQAQQTDEKRCARAQEHAAEQIPPQAIRARQE